MTEPLMKFDTITVVACNTTTTTATTTTPTTTTGTTGTTTTGTTTTGTTTTTSGPNSWGSRILSRSLSYHSVFTSAVFEVEEENVLRSSGNQYYDPTYQHAGVGLCHSVLSTSDLEIVHLVTGISNELYLSFMNDADKAPGMDAVETNVKLIASGGGDYENTVDGTFLCMETHPSTEVIVGFFSESGVLVSYEIDRTTGQMSNRFDWSSEAIPSLTDCSVDENGDLWASSGDAFGVVSLWKLKVLGFSSGISGNVQNMGSITGINATGGLIFTFHKGVIKAVGGNPATYYDVTVPGLVATSIQSGISGTNEIFGLTSTEK